jgi:hypothetical protein
VKLKEEAATAAKNVEASATLCQETKATFDKILAERTVPDTQAAAFVKT